MFSPHLAEFLKGLTIPDAQPVRQLSPHWPCDPRKWFERGVTAEYKKNGGGSFNPPPRYFKTEGPLPALI